MATLNRQTLFPLLKAAFVSRIAVEMVSPPGMGKTSVVAQFAQAMANGLGKPFGLAVRHSSTEDPSDVAGPLVVGEGEWAGHRRIMAVRSVPSVMPRPPIQLGTADRVYFPETDKGEALRDSWNWGVDVPRYGIVFLDEFRQADQDVRKPLARFIDERQLGEYSLDSCGHWSIIMASNRSVDRSGAGKELAFIVTRKMVLEIQPDHEALAAWMEAEKFPSEAVGYVRAFPADVFTMAVPEGDAPFCTPRSFCRAVRFLQAMAGKGQPLPVAPIATEAVAGLIGEASAAQLMAYLRSVNDLPTFEQIVATPEAAKLPPRPDVAYAVIQMMAERVTEENVEAAMKYVSRLEPDIQASLVRTLSQKNPELSYNAHFSAWMAKNRSLVAAAFGK